MSEWKPPADAKPVEGWAPPKDAVAVTSKTTAPQPMTTPLPGAAAGPSIGSGMQQAASQEQPGTLMDPSQLGSALDAATRPVQGPPDRFQGYDAQYPGVATAPAAPAGIEPPSPTNKKPREFAYGEGGFVQKPDGTTVDARDARIERDFADRQGVYSTLNLPGASQYSPQREQAMRDAGTWTDADELRKKQAPLIVQSDLLRRKQEQLSKDIEKYNIPKLEQETAMLQGDLNFLGDELKKQQAAGVTDPAAFNETVAQYNEKLAAYNKQADILRPFIEEQQDIQNGFEYLQSKHAQAEKEFAQSPTQKTAAARQAIADERFAAAEKDIRQGNYLTGNVLDQYVVSPVTATVTKGILGAAGALNRGLDAWVNIPNAVTGDEANYSPFAKAADNLFSAAEELAPTPKQASQPIFDKEWNMDTHALLPKAMQAATYMGMLGVAGVAGGEPGMMAASYMTTEEDYYKEAIAAGLKPGEAQAFSMTSAALTSFLEKANPGPMLNGKTVKGAMLERAAKALRDGRNWREAVKDGTQYVIKEGGGEGLQEGLQALGDDAVKGVAKVSIGDRADGLETNTAQGYAENVLLGLSMGTLAAIGGKAMDRPLHMQSLDWAVRNRQKVEDYIKNSGRKDADVLLERLDKISRVYAGNNLTAMPPEKSAKVASLVEQKNEAEKEVKEKPMDPVLEAAIGNQAKQRVNELTTAMIEAMGIPADKAKAALIGAGMEKAPEGTKAVTNPDGSVTLEKKPETGGAKAATATASAQPAKKQPTSKAVESVFSADEATGEDEEPTAAPAESSAVDSPVSDEAAIPPVKDKAVERVLGGRKMLGVSDAERASQTGEFVDKSGRTVYVRRSVQGYPTVEALVKDGNELRVVGRVHLSPKDFDAGYIVPGYGAATNSIEVSESERRKGIGSAMMQFASQSFGKPIDYKRIPRSEPVSEQMQALINATTNEDQLAPKAPAAAQAEDTGAAPGVPVAEQPAAEQVATDLTEDLSDDPKVLADAYYDDHQIWNSNANPEYAMINAMKGRVKESSYDEWGDPNDKGQQMAKTYFAKKDARTMANQGQTLDQIAQELTEELGREVSPDELAELMRANQSGLPRTSPRMRQTADRYKAITGKRLTSANGARNLKQKGKAAVKDSDTKDFIDQHTDQDGNVNWQGVKDNIHALGFLGYTDEQARELEAEADRQLAANAGGGKILAAVPEAEADAGRGADKERAVLEETLVGARKELEAYERYFKKQAESLFDKDAVESKKRGKVKRAEPSMFEAEGDTRANTAEDMEAGAKTLRDRVALAQKALADYDTRAEARAQAAAQQTSIDQAPSGKELWQMTGREAADLARARHPSPIRTPQHETLKAISDKANRAGYNPDALTPERLAPLREAKLISRSEANPKLTDEGHSALSQAERDFRDEDLSSASASDEAVDAAFDEHKSAVKQAIAEGKPVPAEVLAEYPDLKPKAPATPANMTEASVINRDYRKLKEDLGEKKAKKYFEQVDRLFNPNSTRVVEYRKNGVVTESDGKRTFHALADMDSKKWRVSFSSGIEDVSPSNDTKVGKNAAGEQLYDRADGSRYRMRFDRKDRPSGYPDFGGDLSPVEAPAQAEAPLPKKEETTYEAKARKAAAALERAKLKPDQLYALPLPPSVWNGAIRAMQEVIIAGGKAVDAIAAAIKHIQESDWWKNKATQKEKDEVTSHLKGKQDALEAAIAAEAKAEEPPPTPKAKSEPSGPKEVKKTFTTKRAYEGDFRDEVKAELKKGGLTREVENREEARERGDAIIAKVGLDAALAAAKAGDIRGGARSAIIVRALEDIKRKMDTPGTTQEEMTALAIEQSDLVQWHSQELTEAGREASMMDLLYQESELGFTVAARTSDWKKKTGEDPSEDQIKRWKEVEAEMEAWKEKWADAEKRAEEAEAAATMKALQDSVARQRSVNRKTTPAQRSKVLADKIRTLKIGQRGVMSATIVPPQLWDGAVEAVAQAMEATGKLATAIEAGLKKIRESDWYKKLQKDEQQDSEASFTSAVNEAMADDVESGPIRIPKQMIREAVANGAKDIDSLVATIKEQLKEAYPDATDRQIRDAITEYGKVVNLNKDELSAEVRRIKRIGRIVSALEDVANQKRPLRSGLQRDKLDAEERALNKELREAMKDLPVDAEAQARELRTALDAAKTRARNRIEDLQREIDTRQRTPRSTTRIEPDAELEALIAEKEELEKEHDAIFGDKSLTEEERLKRVIDATRRSVEALEQKVRDKNVDPAKPQSVPETPELKALRQRREKLREEYRRLQEEAGVITRRKLDTAKKAAKARIQELERRIDQGDFSKKEAKPPVTDNELIRLQAEKMRLKEEYDKEFYKHKLLNRTMPERVKDSMWEAWGLTRALRASFDLSFVMMQGGLLTTSYALHRPAAVGRAFKAMWQAMRSKQRSEDWSRWVKAQDWYPMLKGGKLAFTEPHAELSAREELFMSDWSTVIWNTIGKVAALPVRALGKKAYDSAVKKWATANLFNVIERGAAGYLTSLRIERALDGVEMVRMDKGREPTEKEVKDICDAVNTLTGRASIGKLEPLASTLAKIVFSTRLWASAIKTATPYAFHQFGLVPLPIKNAETGKWELVNSKGITPTARKMALQDLGRFIGTTMGIVALAATYLNNDDDDETGVETDPRSADFGKIKIGNKYIDPWGGRIQQLVFSTRMTIGLMSLIGEGMGEKPLPAYKDRKTGEVTPLGQGNTPTMMETALRMAQNKLAPSAGMVAEALMTKVRKDGTRTSFGQPYDMSDELVSNLYPIYGETVRDLAKEDPAALSGFLMFDAFFGGGVNVDEPKVETGRQQRQQPQQRPQPPRR